MIPYQVIEAKRDGARLDPGVLGDFLRGYLRGSVHDYQMSAFLMAAYLRGVEPEELDVLLEVMVSSGAVLEWPDLPGPVVDKHSTGGVGDKVSLPLAPLAAELGLFVPMMSGRGLGHTGGTLDKLEAIPGFRTALPLEEFRRIVREEGFAMIGQTEEIAPLDRRLYALRSVTGTVSSLPLIAASIMSKKVAEGLMGLVLDVKVGSGAFLPEPERAWALARTMVELGEARGVRTVARITAMDRPLGETAGNALEVREALSILRGEGPGDLRELTLELAVEMLRVGGGEPDPVTGRRRAEAALDGGGAMERFLRVVRRQGGDPVALLTPGGIPSAPVLVEYRAPVGGWVARVEPRSIGYGVIELGGGRRTLEDTIDPRVGFELLVRPGERIAPGELLARVHAADEAGGRGGVRVLEEAIQITAEAPPPALPLLGGRIPEGG